MKKISLTLGTDSINDAISKLSEYCKIVEENTKKLKIEIAKELRDDIAIGFNGKATYDDIIEPKTGMRIPNVQVDYDKENGDNVTAHGIEAVFVEFGAGVHYNPPAGSYPHPNPPEGIVPIGKYGHGRGSKDVWSFKHGGKKYVTQGTPAEMPMYNSTKEMRGKIPEIASKIFEKSGGTI